LNQIGVSLAPGSEGPRVTSL